MSEVKEEPRGKRYLSLRIKIVFGFILIFTPVFVASYYWFYQYTSGRVLENITDDLINTIEGAIDGMDKDAFKELIEYEQTNYPDKCLPDVPQFDADPAENGYYPEENPLYIQHVEWLRIVQSVEPETKMYTYIKGPRDGEVVGIGSTGFWRDPRGGFRFCHRYTSTSSRIYDGLTERVDAWGEGYEDEFGRWITTYMPIKDDNGESIAALGVDISIVFVDEVKQDILNTAVYAFIGSYVLIFVLVYYLSGVVTAPLINLTNVAKEIGDGKYEQDLSGIAERSTFHDEIVTLSAVFDVMIDKVHAREKSLRDRVQQLEIIIDKGKRDEELDDIVNTDFFQDLKGKASRLKKKKDDKKGEDKK